MTSTKFRTANGREVQVFVVRKGGDTPARGLEPKNVQFASLEEGLDRGARNSKRS